VRCQAGHCTTAFHPLCARNSGHYLTTREVHPGKPAHRVYCSLHSQAQREKDMGLAATTSLVSSHPFSLLSTPQSIVRPRNTQTWGTMP